MPLVSRWKALTQVFDQPDATMQGWQVIISHYEAPGRYYHNLAHLADLYQWFDRYRAELKNPFCFAMAIWFHDLIYDPTRHDNEQQSARLATELLRQWRSAPERIARVEHLILATEGHQPRSEHPDQRWFLDFDLSILGSDPARYDQYAQQIQQEYQMFPEEAYRAGRRQVIERLLRRERLYLTEAFFAEMEAQARENLRREKDQLMA
jgi:predicted metal-dependent HD superfamily phosphohydrolase